jgi:L-glutamine-phosphate cytidylyltransferase
LVARQAHNLKVVGSNPTPATNIRLKVKKNNVIYYTIMKYQSITLAAGLGSRLNDLTKHIPKSLLTVKSKSIIEHQLDAFYKNNIHKNIIVTGYCSEKFTIKNCIYVKNENYKKNNILNSLFYAKKFMNTNTVVSYSDILFKHEIISELIADHNDVTLVVDKNWRDNYSGRLLHPMEEAEKVCLGADQIINIGKKINNLDANAEFIGLLKLSKRGCILFKKYFELAKENFSNKKFYESDDFSNAYITDFIKYLIENDIKINFLYINSPWMEIDTKEDFLKSQKFFE